MRPSRGGGDERISLIATAIGEFNQHRATVVHRNTVIHWPPKIETDERRHQRQQLENGIAGKAACTSDPSENERNRLALCPVAQELYATVDATVKNGCWIRFGSDANSVFHRQLRSSIRSECPGQTIEPKKQRKKQERS